MAMASQEKIEELYYKAVKGARLDEPAVGDPGPPCYPTEEFCRWARKIDIYTLGEGTADFSKEQHEEIVTKFGEYRHIVTVRLSNEFAYNNVSLTGHLVDIGSCMDGSKVGAVNEMDSLYVIQGTNLILAQAEKQGTYHVFLEKGFAKIEIQPRRLRDELATKCNEVISQMKLPSCLEHGGYNISPPSDLSAMCSEKSYLEKSGYSGVRYNGPAVTSQFLTNDHTLLTWDITPVVALNNAVDIQQAVRESIQAITADNPDRMFPPSDVHLFPDSVENLWRLSTAQLEADVLGRLSRIAPFKEAFSSGKVLVSSLKRWNDENRQSVSPDVDIAKELMQHQQMTSSTAKRGATQILNNKMKFAHIWIPAGVRDRFHEDTKSDISINNAAVKHIMLKAACRMKGAFAAKKNPAIEKELMRTAFEVLGNDESYTSEHAFLKGMRISHFSVAPRVASQKLTLSRDISQQCKTLLSEVMTESLMTIGIGQLLYELDQCAVSSAELWCPEYSFKLNVNPWQHPCMDKNIHHLLTLIAALCNTCGGLIYLIADAPQERIPSKVIEAFQSRLMELLPETKISFIHLSPHSWKDRPWVAIHLKKSEMTVKHAPWYARSDFSPLNFGTDLYGAICTEERSAQRQQAELVTYEQAFVQEDSCARALPASTCSESAGNCLEGQLKREIQPNAENEREETSPMGAEEPQDPIMIDFSSCGRLEWSRNKKDWQNYVKVNTPTVESMIASCSLWKATQPMTVTPNKESLARWLDCETDMDMDEILSETDTQVPGFAIVCKTWKFHVSRNESESLPRGHICDILTVSQHGRISLWVICHDLDGRNINAQMEYLMITGRMMKYQLVHQAVGDVSNLCVECHLLFPSASAAPCDPVRSAICESSQMQSAILHVCHDPVNFDHLQRGLAMVILSKESPLRRQVGDQTTVTLSRQQAELLLYNGRVNYVVGPAGSGKSYTAAFIYKMYGGENSVYICTTKEFVEYLKFCGYVGTLVQNDWDLLRKIREGAFQSKTCVIIDDSHNLPCTKSSMKMLFKLLRGNRAMSLFVFADNDYQSFDRQRQQAMRDCIRELSLEVLGSEPHYAYLNTIYRNTQKVVSFVQSVIQDSIYENHRKIVCGNPETGDGIECIRMTNIWVNSAENDLVVYLRNLQSTAGYMLSEIALLLDPAYTTNEIEECRSILRQHIPDRVQSARIFPRTGVVVDSVSSFFGLDAPVCVFILSLRHKMEISCIRRLFQKTAPVPDVDIGLDSHHFKVFMATRATQKAVFVVPGIDAEIVRQLKFDQFGPPVEFWKLKQHQRYQVQRPKKLPITWAFDQDIDFLWGFCYDENKIYCVEGWDEDGVCSYRYCLSMYESNGQGGTLSLLDSILLGERCFRPRADRQSHKVYIPCGKNGVKIFRCVESRLMTVGTLGCVRRAVDVAVMSVDSICVCDWEHYRVCIVNVRTDTVIRRLYRPAPAIRRPYYVSALGKTILVCYHDYGGRDTMVTYRSDSQTFDRLLRIPDGLHFVSSITTDGHSSFLVTDWDSDSVFVLDKSGTLRHRIQPCTDSRRLLDCAVVQSQLWLWDGTGNIVVMASQ